MDERLPAYDEDCGTYIATSDVNEYYSSVLVCVSTRLAVATQVLGLRTPKFKPECNKAMPVHV
jgi:hypothetical protein